jgi:Dockerin type I domain
MKIKSFLLTTIALSGMLTSLKAQLYNNGGTITIQNNAYVTVSGELINTTGTISNNGKLEVKGNFTNSGVYNSVGAEDSLLLTGTGPVVLNAGAATINFLTINKTTNADIVKLGGNILVNKKLDFLSGLFTTDPLLNPSFAVVSPITAVYNFAPGAEIIGSVKRTGWANGSANVFNQTNMLVTTNAGTTPTDVTVTMLPQTGGGDPTQNEREVTRSYKFAQTGGAAFTADIRYPYLTTELNTNTEANLVPWKLVATEWNGLTTGATRDILNHYVNYTAIPAADLALEWKLADPRYTFNVTANLRGSWNGSTAMNTTLNTAGQIPLTQPYNVTPFSYTGTEAVAAIPNANVVDWVLVEHRKPSTGLPADALSSTITGRKAAFLLNNGTVVELDGVTPVTVDIAKQGPAFVTVRHRNHLGVLSNVIPSNAAGTFTNDYTVLANSYIAPGASSDPVVLLAGVGGKYGMWAGDANKNGIVNSTDVNAIKSAIASSATGYLFTDVNLSNSINSTDVNLTKAIIAASAGGSNPSLISAAKKIKSNIPDQIVE